MADEKSTGSASTSDYNAESSESTININVKTLESQIYSFQVNGNMPVPSLKEKVASATGVPVEQQRLIFRGKVLKDDQMLSEYHVEDGHTLHLVVRPPAQSQSSTGTSSGETNRNTDNRGNDAGSGVPRGRMGVSRSVVLGSFNVGDQGGEGSAPDLSRIIGAVLNSFGIGNQNPTGGANNVSSTVPSNASSQPPQGVETSGTRGNNGGRSHPGNQMPPGQAFTNLPFQSVQQSLPFPLTGAAAVIPTPQMHIPDALHTLSEFINRMESALSATGYWPSPSPTNVGDPPREDLPSNTSEPSPSSTNEENSLREALPSNARGLPTPEALSIVLRRAEHLISGHAVAALSHIAGRLEEEESATDPTVRNQIQTEAVQVGLATQHLGSLLLELGRTILTLRMGQSPAQSLVYAGPAVYISPSGPNPIMVQPFPLQTSSLFGGPASSQTIPGMMGPVGSGDALRNVNIHIHAIGSRGNNGERNNNQQPPNGSNSGPTRVVPPTNGDSPDVPSSQLLGEATNHALNAFSHYGRAQNSNQTQSASDQNPGAVTSPTVQPNVGDSPSASVSLPALVAEVNAQIRNLIDTRGGNQVQSGQSQDTTPSVHDIVRNHPEEIVAVNGAEDKSPERAEQQQPKSEGGEGVISGSDRSNEASSTSGISSKSEDISDEASKSKDVPLGLGLGGLQPKRRTKQVKNTSGPSRSNENHQLIGQHVLQSLVSQGPSASPRDTNDAPPPSQPQGMAVRTGGGARDPSSGQIDPARMMSQVLNSPALNGLLSGVSQQAGIGSPDGLRNMLTQFTQSPSMMNTMNQIVQQIDGQDILSNLPGMTTGAQGGGGGFDLSRMFQQMMPIVSQALAGSGAAPARESSVTLEPTSEQPPERQIGIEQIVDSIERDDSPQEIFGNVLELVSSLTSDGSFQELISELSTSEELANGFMDMVYRNMGHQV